MRRRVGDRRRCFVFIHPAMPWEPLVVLHVALMDHVGDNIAEIVHRRTNEHSDESSTNNAVFYSISSTQKGLQGIDLGTMLIKRVVGEIQRENEHIVHFSTLSPIPGFRSWLSTRIKTGELISNGIFTAEMLDNVRPLMSADTDEEASRSIMKTIESNDWHQLEKLKCMLMCLCAKYLYSVKHRGFAVDPVANFHLRNGAQLYRINWKADTSPRGMSQSIGIMVNYNYKLSVLERNSSLYLTDQTIHIHDQVFRYLR